MRDSKEVRIKQLWPTGIFAGIVFLIILSALSFWYSYRQLNQNIQQERKDYVSEISRQLDSNISTVRSTNLRFSSLLADTLSYVQPDTFEQCAALFQSYAQNGSSIFLVTADGTVLSPDGAANGISNRDCVSQVLRQDQYSAFERIGTEKEYWLFSTRLKRPCTVEGQIIQTAIIAWEKEAYSKNMTISIFDGLGYSFLVKGDGVVTISLETVDQAAQIGFNIFTTLEDRGIAVSALDRLRSDLNNGRDNALVCELGNIQWLLQYHQLEEGNFTFIMLPLTLTAAGTYQAFGFKRIPFAVVAGNLRNFA